MAIKGHFPNLKCEGEFLKMKTHISVLRGPKNLKILHHALNEEATSNPLNLFLKTAKLLNFWQS